MPDSPLLIERSRAWVAVAGPVVQNALHQHHALQLSVVLGGGTLRAEVAGRQLSAEAVLIEQDQPHRLEAGEGLTLLIEPESHLAGQLRTRWLQGATFCAELPEVTTLDPGDLLAHWLPEACTERHLESRVGRVLAWIDELERAGRLDQLELGAALAQVQLSESRFLHVFREAVGLPWRPYVRWRRALCAMARAQAGASLTEAAHAAGYSDQAHFSRHFKATFGMNPSAVVARSRFVQGE